MYLREFLNKTIKTTINGMISEGKPIPMDTPNDFVYPDFKKYAYKNRKMFKKELQKSNGDSSKMSLTLSALWYKWARKNHPNFTHIKDSKKFGRALMVMMVKDDLIFSIDAFKKTNNIAKLKEDSELDQAFLKAKPVEEETKRDYKKEYAKYGKSKKAKKYRAELNKYNRDKGTYGNGDGKDASHKGGKIVGFEAQSKNRGRREKSRLKKEATFVPNSGTMSGGVLRLDNRKYQLKKDIKNVSIGSYIVTLPKGTILYNIAGGLFADHKSLEQYETRSQKYFKKSTFRGIQVKQKTDTIKDVEKNSKVLENVAPNHNGKSAPFGSGYDELKEACWKGYKAVGGKMKNGKRVPNCVPEGIVKEGVMSDIHYLINKSKSVDDFIKTFFKEYGKQVKKSKDSIEWIKGMYNDVKNESVNEAQKVNSTSKKFLKGMKKIKVKGLGGYMPGVDYVYIDGNKYYFVDFEGDHMEMKNTNTIKQLHKLHGSSLGESVNEAKFYITRNLGRGQGKSLVGGYDLKKDKKLPPKVFKSYKDAQKEVERLERGGSMGGQMTAYIITDKDMNMLKPNGKKMFESVNEADITVGGKEYNLKKSGSKITLINKKLSADKFIFKNVKDFKAWADDQVEPIGGTQSSHFGINEEQIDEKLITFSNRAPYGQIVFMAGGAGSGKGFAIDNFIDSAGFKVRDVDEMKKAVGKLDQLGKFSVDKWYKKYGKKLSDKPKNGGLSPKAHIEEFVLGKGLSISDISKDLKNPNNVASLHYIVDSMGLKDKWLISMLSGKDNKETLPNLLFDITAKKVSALTDVIKPLIANGYDSKNVHLIWVLSNFHVAIKANKERDRMVPEDILLQTHEGAGKTMWSVMTKILPKGINGRIDVILNKYAETVPYVDSNGKPILVQPNQKNKLEKAQIVVKGFTSLPIKKQGGGVQPEKAWKEILKKWVLDNAPKTIDLSQQIEEGNNDYFKTAGEAVEFAKKAAEKKGFDIDEDDWNSQITMGGKYNRLRPGVGKTHSFQIGLLKKGKPQRKGLAISLYGMDSGKYELTHYIN